MSSTEEAARHVPQTAIPRVMRERAQWLVREADKSPHSARTRHRVDATMPHTWSSLEYAQQAMVESSYPGLGFALSPDDSICCVDLDKCRNPETGAIEARALAIVGRLRSYTEVSLSGTGLHIFVLGELPSMHRQKTTGIEIYSQGRYIAFTGDRYGEWSEIEYRGEELLAVYREAFPDGDQEPYTGPGSVPLEDDEVLQLLREAKNSDRFQRVWDGDTSGHISSSEARMAIYAHLAFYTQDPEQIERLARQSKLEWTADSERLVAFEIDKILARLTTVYRGFGPGDRHKFNDVGNAARLVHYQGDRIRYSELQKRWYVWDGKRWKADTRAEIVEVAKETARQIYIEAAAVADPDARLKVANWAKNTENRQRLVAMIELAKSNREIAIGPEDMDADDSLLNVTNGTVDLRTGELLPHDPDRLITRLAPVHYDPDASFPVWDDFLADSTGNDPAFLAYLQRCAGYSLTGFIAPDAEEFYVLLGPKRSGKSTFLSAMAMVLGDYASNANAGTFMDRRDKDAPRQDLARLEGIRFVRASEPDQSRHWSSDTMKQITGGDRITARFLYANDIEFQPKCKIWIAANESPQANETDDAFWRRLRRLPFEKGHEENDHRPELKAQILNRELSGAAILAWAVKGALAFFEGTVGIPAIVKQRTEALRELMDRATGFFDDECAFEPGATVFARDIKQAYVQWARDANIGNPLASNQLAERLRARGAVDKRVGRGKRWDGVRLLSPAYSGPQPGSSVLIPDISGPSVEDPFGKRDPQR